MSKKWKRFLEKQQNHKKCQQKRKLSKKNKKNYTPLRCDKSIQKHYHTVQAIQDSNQQ